MVRNMFDRNQADIRDMESIYGIEVFLRSIGVKPDSNYFMAEKSWRPTLQLRGSRASMWTYFSRKPYLLIVTDKELVLYDYLAKDQANQIAFIPFKELRQFEIEKLTPFKEYCLSFEYGKKYYFYIESEVIGEIEFSCVNFHHLLDKKFNGLIK